MENNLVRLAEFRQALKHYRVSEPSKQILARTKLVLLVAPSAGGRNTIIKKLTKMGDYYFVVSDTTRRPRVNNGVLEENGKEYWFRSEDEMLQDIKSGKFLEAEVIHGQQVSGISIRELKKASDNNKIAITDVDIGGISNIIDAKPDTIAIAVLPPSFEEWQRRLSLRGPIETREYNRRMQTAIRIFKEATSHSRFTFVINDKVELAAAQIDQIVKQGTGGASKQEEARVLAHELRKAAEAAMSRL
jgi:guanylate kinase